MTVVLRNPDRQALAPGFPGALQRTVGRVEIEFRADDDLSRPHRLYQEGAGRVRLPRVSGDPEAVIINTAGGLTGGDSFTVEAALGPGAALTVASQACERIYRSIAGPARLRSTLRLGAGSRLDWLPQPTIVFDAARLDRRLSIDMAEDATLVALEACILGRTAMAEEVRSGAIGDGWSLRRGGRLVRADRFLADGEIASALSGPATLGRARAFATVLYAAADAEDRLDAVRKIFCTCEGETAASAWNGLMVMRFLAPDGRVLTRDLSSVLTAFRGRPLPRVWSV